MSSRDYYYAIACCQKNLVGCGLVSVITIIAGLFLLFLTSLMPETSRQTAFLVVIGLVVLIHLAIGILAIVFNFRLAIALYGGGLGTLMGLLMLIPYLGAIFMLLVHLKAASEFVDYFGGGSGGGGAARRSDLASSPRVVERRPPSEFCNICGMRLDWNQRSAGLCSGCAKRGS